MHCGVSTRTFYNCFLDKHDAVAHAYYEKAKPYMDADLRTWNDFRCDYYMKEYNFMRHTLCYTGENNIADVILAVEREKYRRHIRQELYEDPESMELIMSGMNYMIYGNIGLLKENYKSLRSSITKVSAYYQLAWDMMQSWSPQIVRNSMEHEPVRAAEPLPIMGNTKLRYKCLSRRGFPRRL